MNPQGNVIGVIMKKIFICFFLALISPPTYADQLILDNAEVYYGDFNGDGLFDLYIKTRPIILIQLDDISVPIMIKGSSVLVKSSGAIYTTTINPGAVTYDANTLGSYTIVRGDFNGDGLKDVLFTSSQSNILMLASNGAPYVNYIQTLTASSVGYDLGFPGTTVVAQDVTGDGRSDLIIKRDGSYVGALVANTDGTLRGLPSDQDAEITVAMVWQGFKGALSSNDTNGALQFIGREQRQKYADIFSDLGITVADSVIKSITAVRQLATSDGVVTYGVTRNVNGQAVANIVTFFRDSEGAWRIDGL